MTLPALEQAITFLSRADLIASARQQALPVGVTDILKISSGDNDALLAAQESSRLSLDDVRHAAQFYVQQILFAPDSDHYRVLGVDPDDAEAKIKLHYRLLVRWLHPDKNSSDWEAVFSDRVNRAWHSLRTPERRREYDLLLKSQSSYQVIAAEPSRTLEPGQLRRNKVDERFMSSRAIKRLPIAVFGLLGASAIFALWWLSQIQPNLQATAIASSGSKIDPRPLEAPSAMAQQESLPPTSASPEISTEVVTTVTQNPVEAPVAEVADGGLQVQEDSTLSAAKPVTKAPIMPIASKPVALSGNNTAPSETKKKNTSVENTRPVLEAGLTRVSDTEGSSVRTAVQSNKPTKAKPASGVSQANTSIDSRPPAVMAVSQGAETMPGKSYDANVKQFLQQFSRIYADGDYFALHNLFTKDLNILSAPPQRSVLRSYRQLFESSKSREIALDHVTWLANEESIVVIASYQTQVLPHGKAEAQSSRGDIRLDLRMENGQLRIVRLQSDSKNG